MMAMTMPAWLTGAAIMNQMSWATTKNRDQFMASSVGQTVQALTITTAALFAAFRAGKAVTSGSYADAIPCFVYGVTAIFAWIGKNTALRLMQAEGAVAGIVANEEDQAANAAQMLKAREETGKSLKQAKLVIEDLEKVNAQLIEKFTTAQEDLANQAREIQKSQDAAIKAAEAFERLKARKDFYKTQCASLMQQIAVLSKQKTS